MVSSSQKEREELRERMQHVHRELEEWHQHKENLLAEQHAREQKDDDYVEQLLPPTFVSVPAITLLQLNQHQPHKLTVSNRTDLATDRVFGREFVYRYSISSSLSESRGDTIEVVDCLYTKNDVLEKEDHHLREMLLDVERAYARQQMLGVRILR
jgi:hypothetical protein